MAWNPYTKEEIAALEAHWALMAQVAAIKSALAASKGSKAANVPADADLPDTPQPGALQWQPIETAPKGEYVLVCGKSGGSFRPDFIIIAIYDAVYSPSNPWRDLDLHAVSDNGWTPLFWCPLPAVPATP